MNDFISDFDYMRFTWSSVVDIVLMLSRRFKLALLGFDCKLSDLLLFWKADYPSMYSEVDGLNQMSAYVML